MPRALFPAPGFGEKTVVPAGRRSVVRLRSVCDASRHAPAEDPAQMTATRHAVAPGELPPVTHRRWWLGAGLALQGVGTAIPLAIGYDRGAREGLGGHVTLATVRLVWHQMLHDHHDVVRIVIGVVLFVIGSVVLARPFCRRVSTLLIAVPLAALVGVAALGAIALLLALVAAATNDLSTQDSSGMGRGSRRPIKRPKGSARS